jgi:hypothetical protein
VLTLDDLKHSDVECGGHAGIWYFSIDMGGLYEERLDDDGDCWNYDLSKCALLLSDSGFLALYSKARGIVRPFNSHDTKRHGHKHRPA